MKEATLRSSYFRWLCAFVCPDELSQDYKKLLHHLDSVDFTYGIPALDSNRAMDGIDLRYRYGCEKGVEPAIIATILDSRPCSVLEMMVALAVRCEETIMLNNEYGDRTPQWFWDMVANMHLDYMYDSDYDQSYVDERLRIFLERDYGRDGDGALFLNTKPLERNSTVVEIWTQLQWYLDAFREEFEKE